MRFPTQLWINGRPCAGSEGQSLPAVNPATEKTLCDVAAASVADVDTAAQHAQRCFESGWRDLARAARDDFI